MDIFRWEVGHVHCAILGSLGGSGWTEESERSHMLEKIHNILERLNGEYVEYIATRFTLTHGDEFQGVLRVCWPAVIPGAVIRELYPLTFQSASDQRAITRVDYTNRLRVDGPAHK
jgi:hypothetical protein